MFMCGISDAILSDSTLTALTLSLVMISKVSGSNVMFLKEGLFTMSKCRCWISSPRIMRLLPVLFA